MLDPDLASSRTWSLMGTHSSRVLQGCASPPAVLSIDDSLLLHCEPPTFHALKAGEEGSSQFREGDDGEHLRPN